MANERGGSSMGHGGTSGSDRVVTVDARLAYAVLAVIAVVAIAGIGVWISRMQPAGAAGEAATASQAQSVSGAVASATSEAGLGEVPAGGLGAALPNPQAQLTLNVPTTVDGQSMIKPVVRGVSPVRPDEVPVGPSEPRIWFTDLAGDNWELRLGEVDPTGPVERDVVIENIGTSPLALAEAGGTCGCTALVLEAQELPPAGRAVMRVKYDPRVSKDAGKDVKKQVWVRSNDPLAPVAEFYITANVRSQ